MKIRLKSLLVINAKKKVAFTTALSIILLSFPVVAASKPLFTWNDDSSSTLLGKIWTLSNINSNNTRVVVDLHQSIGFRCQSPKPCPEPRGYYRISYVFNCPAKLAKVNNKTLASRGDWQKLGDFPSQPDFATWEVFAVACPMWNSEIKKLRQDGYMDINGFVKSN